MILRECHDSVLCIIFILASGVLCADPNNDTYNFLDAVKSLIFGDDATSNSVCCASSMRTQPPYMNLTVRQLPDITLASRPQAQKLIVYPQPQTFSAHNNQAPKLSIRSVGSVGACNLPQQIGTGPYRIPRWYYNPARMRCELFYWSGCCGNANNFQTFQSCQQSCEGSGPSYSCGGSFNAISSPSIAVSMTNSKHCLRPLSVGYGSLGLPRWYFDTLTGSCKLFIYRGNGGNGNVFRTLDDCKSTCRGMTILIHPEVDPCTQERDQGVGSMRLPRYTFNKLTKICEPFTYFGSAGNRNNFHSLQDCQQQCPESPNPCPHAPIIPQTQCSVNVGSSCASHQFCHNGYTPSTTVCCNRPAGVDRCSQQVIAGIGNANLVRWYFNQYTQQCQQFIYNGLQGNENNFLTQQECQNACVVNPCFRGQPLKSQGVNVQCSALNQAVCPAGYFCHIGVDSRTSVCCLALGASPCMEPMKKGEGKSSLTRYYYDAEKRMCLTFNYFGLKGNTNNFLSRDACEAECPVWINPCAAGEPLMGDNKRPRQCHQQSSCPGQYFCHIGHDHSTTVCCPSLGDPCVMPLNIGKGEHNMTRWYYNEELRQCQPFTYGGLGGNDNNFLLPSDCESVCPVWINPCTDGDPLLLSNGQPKLCTPLEADSCPPTHWCHPGLEPSTTVCCPGHTDACMLSRVDGKGSHMQMRWYYEPRIRQCVQFSYKGMKGNANNFMSREDCEATCPIFIDPCPHAYTSLSSSVQQIFSCSASKPQCPPSYWCHIGEDADTSVCCPNAGDACAQPVKYSGIGVLSLKRWSYDVNQKKCIEFEYHGLKGNENNFLSKEACEKRCPVFENPCLAGEPYIVGSRPYVCSAQSACPQQYYCHIGSKDQFHCCPIQSGDPCAQPLERGQGGYSLQRWYWNTATRQCVPFSYGGLKGTQNNFLSQQDCEETCRVFQNPCALGNPQLNSNNQPVTCASGQSACSATYWCHIGAVPQTTVCCPGRVQDEAICAQPMTMGAGNANLQRWYFDANARKCVPFIYGGFYGNQNNFQTLQQCQQACPSYVNVCPTGSPLLEANNRPRPCTFGVDACGTGYWCHLGLIPDEYQCCPGRPTNPAACEGMPYSVGVMGSPTPPATRWYYDQKTMSCKTFEYNGRKGNQNNFLTQADCEATCHVFVNPCLQPISLPPQRCTATADTCAPGTFCLIGISAETSVCCPTQGNPCLLPLATGTGSSYVERWFFNSQTGTCQSFTYTGLKGNENNFLTRERCEETCGPNPCPEGRPLLGADGRPQSCNAAAQSSTCPSTYWCHTGANALNTLCCPGAVSNPCILPMAAGEGNENLERFYFDPSAQACRPFIYRGIKGNQNNFLTLRACQVVCHPLQNPCIGQPATTAAGQVLFCSSTNKDTCPVNFWCHVGANPETTVCCPGATNPCSVPLSPGTGNAGLQRWYYNADDRECQPFQYNGMRGNQNNFESQAECARTCPVFVSPCIEDSAKENDSPPMLCNPLLASSCDEGFFCLAGDTAFKESSFCCPKLADDPCKVYLNEGEGEQSLPRWYYSSTEGECFPFTYRGRRGNQNNFLTKRFCEEACQPTWNVCFGGEEPLRINGRIAQCSLRSCPRTHYCHIGENSRSTVCCQRKGNVCDQQLMIGVGNAQLPRWYYSSVQDDCIPFNYSGLAGNENNFLTKADCQVTCPDHRGYCPHGQPLVANGKVTGCGVETFCPRGYVCHVTRKNSMSVCCPDPASFCLLEREPGLCHATIPRYGYNKLTGICQRFEYGGCLGNLNNFLSLEACTEVCCDKGYN